MKIMVTGHNGMLGREVVKAIKRMGHDLMLGMGPTSNPNTRVRGIDITEEILVADCCPEVVINCAGLVPQRDPIPSPAEMMRVNGYGPWNLADWCEKIEAWFIHVSTDCVFDGGMGGPYSETDKPIRHLLPAYALSKWAGEVMGDKCSTVRTSFVGFGERGLISELRQCVANNDLYKASFKLLWTGHTAPFVARALVLLAERKISGLLHIPAETLTRYELVVLLRKAFDLDVDISKERLPDIDRRLTSERWAKEDLPDLPSFEWQLEWLRRSQ